MEYGYDGAWCPRKCTAQNRTFSVGIFPILQKANGNGTKRGAVVVMVKGYTSSPGAVYKKAEEIVRILNSGEEYNGPKTITCGTSLRNDSDTLTD